MRRYGATILLLATAGAAGGALIGPPRPAAVEVGQRPEAVSLLVWASQEPVRLELRVEVDGQPVAAVWDDTFRRLFAFHDRDGDGKLDRQEAARLPGHFELRQVLWGQLPVVQSRPPAWEELDADRDGRVSPAELAGHYRRYGLGNVLIGAGRPPATDRLTEALLKALGAGRNDKVTEGGWKGAVAAALAKLDTNDDELVGPGELVPGIAYPGALGANLVLPPAPKVAQSPVVDGLPVLLLPAASADRHWAALALARREVARLPAVREGELLRLREAAPAVAWTVRLGKRAAEAAALEAKTGAKAQPGLLVLDRGGVRIDLRVDDGQLPGRFAAARRRVEALFLECDRDGDGALGPGELTAAKAAGLKRLSTVADRDGDGKLTRAELAAWLDLQQQVAKGLVLLTLLDHRRGLFEALDEDQDGSLSVPELRSAWARLRAAGCLTADGLDRGRLPHRLRAAVSLGQPTSDLPTPVRPGPAWFRAMDRNGDGVVSLREFVGPLEVFKKLDRDGDGLLTPAEAERAGKR